MIRAWSERNSTRKRDGSATVAYIRISNNYNQAVESDMYALCTTATRQNCGRGKGSDSRGCIVHSTTKDEWRLRGQDKWFDCSFSCDNIDEPKELEPPLDCVEATWSLKFDLYDDLLVVDTLSLPEVHMMRA